MYSFYPYPLKNNVISDFERGDNEFTEELYSIGEAASDCQKLPFADDEDDDGRK